MINEQKVTLVLNVLDDNGDMVIDSDGNVVTETMTLRLNEIEDVLDHARQVAVCYLNGITPDETLTELVDTIVNYNLVDTLEFDDE